jgi:hypothetical protein
MARMNTLGKVKMHEDTLARVRSILLTHGLESRPMPITGCSYDLLVGGKARVELKVAKVPYKPKKSGLELWRFNLHRHGVTIDDGADFYVLCLPPIPQLMMKYYTYLVVPADDLKGCLGIAISVRGLLTRWAKYFNRWQDIKDFCANGAK